jgi:hypothetical protein
MVRAAEAVFRQNGIRIAREIAIGEEQELDVGDEVRGFVDAIFRPASIACRGIWAPSSRRCSGYVSHVDIFGAH